ncbi:cellulase family glycosylhydrolase [Cohnella sp. AR92]|uniref:cellulase family glycosylhydrolase n=1 Tax=Cohnella sp. AR92 TaxID=648716 RepID=UPI00131575B9|nr:cellulase family glycosylhydrolase [Cohnella sp. AR92]
MRRFGKYYLVIFAILAILSAFWYFNAVGQENSPQTVSLHPGDNLLDAGAIVLDAPAGKYGFVRAEGDQFSFEGGRMFKIWGTNLYLRGALQSKESAEKLADQLAKLGYNLVRLHGLDNVDGGILAQGDRLALDAEAMDKLDYLIYLLKKKGIYIDLNVHVNNRYEHSDLPQTGIPIDGKQVHYFSEDAEKHLRTYIELLASHLNPYTGLAYRDEPAIAVVELLNEDGMLQASLAGQLNGKYEANSAKNVRGSYDLLLTQKWNEWLKQRYGTNKKLSDAWKGREAGPNLLSSPESKSGLDWFFKTNAEGLQSTVSYDSGLRAIRISTNKLAKAPEKLHIQYGQKGFSMQRGERYELQFDVKADSVRTIAVELTNASEANGSLGTYLGDETRKEFEEIPVTTSWEHRRYVFTSYDGSPDVPAKLDFAVGDSTGKLYLKNISLRIAEVQSLSPGESLELGTVKRTYIFDSEDDSKQRTQDLTEFYYELETGLNERLYKYARSAGFRQPLSFNNWYNGGNLSTLAQSKGDFTDNHIFWDPPSSWARSQPFTMNNRSPVSDPEKLLPHMMMIQAIKDKPYLLSEVNNTFPSDYEYEFYPVLVPYCSLQGIGGIIQYAYTDADIGTLKDDYVKSFLYTVNDPVMNIQSFVYSIAFLKGYVQPAREEIVLNYTKSYSLSTFKQFQDKTNYNLIGTDWRKGIDLSKGLFAAHRVRKQFVPDNESTTNVSEVRPVEAALLDKADKLQSDTGELTWTRQSPESSYLKVDAPKFQSLTGRIATKSLYTSNLSIQLDGDASVSLLSLDDQAIGNSSKVLLSITSSEQNTGQTKDPVTGNLSNWGTAPVILNEIQGTAKVLAKAGVKVYALNLQGDVVSELESSREGEWVRFRIDKRYPWYLLSN